MPLTDFAANSEDRRLAALYEYDVLDSQPEESFDRITRLVKLTIGTPIAVVSFIDRDRQWFKSRQGPMVLAETPRDISFCTHTIREDEPLLVPDALLDPRFRDSPLVTCENGIRFYAGVPLRTPGGFNVGALCAIDTVPRAISPEQVSVMQDLARLVVDELELRKLAAVDSLTGAMTGRAFVMETKKEVAKARRYEHELGCIMFDLDHFKAVNDTYGHAAGDQVLRSVTALCLTELRSADVLARVGGEEFAIMLPETSMEGALQVAEKLRLRLAALPVAYGGQPIPVTASFGVTALLPSDELFSSALKRADRALYQAKVGRNRSVLLEADEQPVQAPAVHDLPNPDRREVRVQGSRASAA